MAAGCDFILDALAREGLTHLFLVPGGLVDPFLAALARHPRLRPIVAAHEGGAAYMADGYARASGRFGAALGIGGPGLCNMATPVAAAKTDASPVLVLSGEIPSAINPPSGCRFHTRCPYAFERCSKEEPEIREVLPGHTVACHLREVQPAAFREAAAVPA